MVFLAKHDDISRNIYCYTHTVYDGYGYVVFPSSLNEGKEKKVNVISSFLFFSFLFSYSLSFPSTSFRFGRKPFPFIFFFFSFLFSSLPSFNETREHNLFSFFPLPSFKETREHTQFFSFLPFPFFSFVN